MQNYSPIKWMEVCSLIILKRNCNLSNMLILSRTPFMYRNCDGLPYFFVLTPTKPGGSFLWGKVAVA